MALRANAASQEIPSDATSDSRRLPWPIPQEGISVELARWWHGPTEKHDAWHVVYRIRIFRDAEEERATFSRKPVYRLLVDSFEEDYFTKAIRPSYLCHDENFVEVSSVNSREAPTVLIAAWDVMVEKVKASAAKQERRYEIAVSREQ
jgi:hypothetical protein